MPWFSCRVSVKCQFSYSALLRGRFAMRPWLMGMRAIAIWMFYLAILLHGVCYDFFFMTGQLYTDQEAPSHLRSTAQGFYMFVTYGLGMLIGSLLSGGAVDYFTTATQPVLVRNWTGFWMSSSVAAFALFLVFALFFRGGRMIRSREPDLQSEKILLDRE